jgi:hypothetical protein
MKHVHQAVLVAMLASTSLLAHAQSNDSSITRAQVRSELIAAEKAGLYPQSDVHYPDPADPVLASHSQFDYGYGMSPEGSVQSGSRVTPAVRATGSAHNVPGLDDIYRGG